MSEPSKMDQKQPTINRKNGFNSKTRTFQSLRPPIKLPLEHLPLTVTAHAFSLHSNFTWPDSVALIDSATGQRITYSELIPMINSLAFYLKTVIKLSKGDVAFVLSTNSVQVPILYLALFSIGVVVSPANPLSTVSEISRQVELSNPLIAFALSSTAHKLPKLRFGTILIDSLEFNSTMKKKPRFNDQEIKRVEVNQSDLAAIMYSSGTTGNIKAVMLTHRNLISIITGYYSVKEETKAAVVVLYTIPLFHVYGLYYTVKSVALSETVVVMGRFDFKKMGKAVQDFRVQRLATAPPVVVAMIKGGVTDGFDMSSLEWVRSGGAPLGKNVIAAFREKFPNILLAQGYGMTETGGRVFGFVGREACKGWGSVGKLAAYCEAKIVEPDTGEALPPGKQGELWLKGPSIMKGYASDPEATSATVVDGWLRTGDLCYIDEEGFMFVVDRLKELIKYKGYQVAPVELEQLLQSHPQISDAAVIPYPDEEAGQIPMAFVVRQPESSSLSEVEIMDFVAQQVAPYKKIRRVAFIDAIPKNPAGKILRRELRKISNTTPAGPSSKL